MQLLTALGNGHLFPDVQFNDKLSPQSYTADGMYDSFCAAHVFM